MRQAIQIIKYYYHNGCTLDHTFFRLNNENKRIKTQQLFSTYSSKKTSTEMHTHPPCSIICFVVTFCLSHTIFDILGHRPSTLLHPHVRRNFVCESYICTIASAWRPANCFTTLNVFFMCNRSTFWQHNLGLYLLKGDIVAGHAENVTGFSPPCVRVGSSPTWRLISP